MAVQRIGQRGCVQNGLRRTVRADGVHGVRGIAQQRGVAMAPARQGVAVHHGPFEDLLGRADQSGHVEPGKAPAAESGQQVVQRAGLAPVLAAGGREAAAKPVFAQAAVADPVDALQAVWAHRLDRVDHEFRPPVTGLHHGAAVQKGPRQRGAAPHHHAVPARGALVGVKLLAQRRVDAVGPHQDVAGPLAARAVGVQDLGHCAVGCFARSHHALAGAHLGRAQALHGLVPQAHLQVTAVNAELRMAAARGKATQIFVDGLPVPVGEHQRARVHGHGFQRGQQTQACEHAHRMRQQVDAHAQRARLRGGFTDRDAVAARGQGQGRRQAADAAAGHNDGAGGVHRVSPGFWG